MFKNQLQELAQRSCFNLPSYACLREGPDHAPRFKASVNFNGEIFEGPSNCTTLRQAEHAAAEVALNSLSARGPSRSLTARVLDETGVYKNLLQETAHRAGLNLPVYTTVRSGPGHLPVFTCTVELAGMNFTGQQAKTKKQAEKNAAMAAWSALKQLPSLGSLAQKKESEASEEQDVAEALSNLKSKEEQKGVRQSDLQQHVRRKQILVFRENSFKSPYHASNNPRSRPLDLLPDGPTVHSRPANPFSTLPHASKILPKIPAFNHPGFASQHPSSTIETKPALSPANRAAQILRSQLQVKIPEMPTLLEEHLKDEEEWLKSDVNKKTTENEEKGVNFTSQSAFPDTLSSPNLPRTGSFRSAHIPPTAPLHCFPHSSVLRSGGFYSHGIAPAVNIRSVIPVCAAPPVKRPPNPSPSQKKESGPSVTAQTEKEISKLSTLQL